jgi:signal peptidase I
MEPTLPIDTHYLVNKWIYRFEAPHRGDIVVFKSPVDPNKGFIKRVIGIPGDQIEIRSKQVYLNGNMLNEPYATHKRPLERLVGDNIAPPVVPPGHVFVLGDDRDESEDSSVWKDPATGEPIYFVDMKNVDGKLIQP